MNKKHIIYTTIYNTYIHTVLYIIIIIIAETNVSFFHVICDRFKLTPDINSLEDMIYGHVEYDVNDNESDPIIMKTDGYPTYHFANVVDDHFMEITHVLRGVEWQISTPKHLQLYR